jgi:hypothetical protein
MKNTSGIPFQPGNTFGRPGTPFRTVSARFSIRFFFAYAIHSKICELIQCYAKRS